MRSLGLYLVRVVKGNNAQGPEAAEHGEDGQAQVVPRGQHDEVVLTLTVTGAVSLGDGFIKKRERSEKAWMVHYYTHGKKTPS